MPYNIPVGLGELGADSAADRELRREETILGAYNTYIGKVRIASYLPA